jgi:hypothetical protein
MGNIICEENKGGDKNKTKKEKPDRGEGRSSNAAAPLPSHPTPWLATKLALLPLHGTSAQTNGGIRIGLPAKPADFKFDPSACVYQLC